MEQRRYACDGCRRRRVRCDAVQPCAQCVRNGIQCTYGSTVSRQSATSYARNLEQQVAELQRQLQSLSNPTLEHVSADSSRETSQSRSQHGQIDILIGPGQDLILEQTSGQKVYRSSAALNVLRTIADMLASGSTYAQPGVALVQAVETSLDFPVKEPLDWLAALLPDKEKIWEKAMHAIDISLLAHDCIDRKDFRTKLDELPTNSDAKYVKRKSFLALVYALLALGELYDYSDTAKSPETLTEMEPSQVPGIAYFRASRCIVNDEHERTDLDSVTAKILQARYLLNASTFSDAHAALTVAISAAMHMGLHLHDTFLQHSFTEEELYQRRRVFAILCMMENYIVWPLGMPRALRSADIKQTLGLTREELLDEGASLIARDPTTSNAETILNEKLLRIQGKILEHQAEYSFEVYPHSDWISDIEVELKEWEQQLPPLSTDFSTPRKLRGQLNLRLHNAAAHLLLYAPCLHHLGRDRSDPSWNLNGYEYGSMCLRAASQAVFLMDTLQANGFMNQIHWVNSYMLAWSATILSYFVIHSRTRVTIAESKKAALLAFDMLGSLGTVNVAARGIHQCIAPYIEIVAAIDE